MLFCAGIVDAVFSAIYCFTPLLVVLLPALGLGAWLAGADYVLFPLLAVSLGVLALGLYRRHARAGGYSEMEVSENEGSKR